MVSTLEDVVMTLFRVRLFDEEGEEVAEFDNSAADPLQAMINVLTSWRMSRRDALGKAIQEFQTNPMIVGRICYTDICPNVTTCEATVLDNPKTDAEAA